MKKITKPLFLALGFISLALAALGVVLPLLPTTPFLLLTAFFFAQGSERFHRWFIATKLYEQHLRPLVRDKTMPLKTKLVICLPVTAALAAAFCFTPHWPARVLIAAALAAKWYFFMFRLKSGGSDGGGGGGCESCESGKIKIAAEGVSRD
ncbi:MAG: YbaN family protein [Gracilibacteraceae bacterium]|jgi:uncharacterized membrane protein YbaN (DUF454 family)|nr:YbaN family protein [Gracilibacteraceae bacterium]